MAAVAALDTPLCVLGGGPHGLALSLHLELADPDLAARVVTLDPSGAWMTTWFDQFRRLGIDVLRSPGVHHPGPNVDELASHTANCHLPTSGLPYDPPTTIAFEAFCRTLFDGAAASAPLPHRPTSMTLDRGGLLVETDGPTIRAERVVIATNPHRRTVPSWVWPTLGTSRGVIAHAADVDLTTVDDLSRESVVVIGGGLTAAHLSAGAIARRAETHLVVRRSLQTRDFDTDPGWLGPKNLRDYEAIEDPSQRLHTAMAARGGGTIPPWMRSTLRALQDEGRLVIHEHDDVAEATAGIRRLELRLRSGETLVADRVWLATGSTPALGALRCMDPLLPDIATVDGLPIPDVDLRIGAPPVHVMGRLATIELGPAAGNLWGARQAARRITRALTGVDLQQLSRQVAHRPPARARLAVRRRRR